MSKDLPINLDNTNDIYRRQASLGGNKITRSVDNTEGNTTLLWGRVTQVYYQKGTCDFKIQGQSNIFVDNSGSDGTLSAPIPVDYYGKNYDGHPFIKTRLIQKGNKVLVAFVNGSTANPVIIGVYPDNSESYELLSPALDNKISDNTEDTNYRVNNEIEITPANQMIYKSGDGSWAKSMQGRSFLIVQGNKNFELEKVSSCYENIPYFYKDNASDEPVNYPTPVYSENTKAPEWLLVHEGNWELDGSSDKHRTRFYVNQEGELQIVFFTLDKPEELLVVDGNKDTGFTIMKQFDSDTPMDKNSKNYVKFNVGDNNEISMSVSPSTDSKEQAQSLEIKSDGIYVNGKLLTSLVGNNQGSSDINVDDVKDIINSTTGIEDWDKFKDSVHKAAQDAQQAADEAKKAGDAADAAGQDAAQAGLDAKLAGENAAQKVSDLKDKMLYYLSLSPEKDLYVPGKYLILNEDVTIKNGFIKEGYIDDAAINSANIKDAAITSAKIKDLSVYSAKIANAAITNAKIADLAVGTAKIRDLAVTDEKVGKLTFNHMIGETLDANLINVTNLTADNIKAHSITADKITVGNLGEISGDLGNITGGNIDAGNVNIDNLPADDPDMLTPEKKVKLRNTVNTLQTAVNAQVDFQNSVGALSDTCDTLKTNMAKLVSDTTPLLRDMNSNTKFDHKLIDTDIDNVNIELNNLSNKAITTIGKTADGKNTIYTGAFAPENPKIGDIWAKPSDDGSNEGTFEVYGQNGWFSPTKDVYNRVESQISMLPKSYYQGNEPTGDIATGSIWYKTKQNAMGNVSFDMYVYQDGKWVAYNDNAIEGLNAKIDKVAATADGKNSIYSSKTAPANPKENDIWIDTGNDNTIKVYIDGQWVSPNQNTDKVQQEIDNAFSKVPQVYYSSTQPTGNIVEGSTWYKTSSDNTYTMYTYKNGQWVGLLDDNINTAVTDATNNINNTINSNVNNLNNSINGVRDDINNINFGARNLLRLSQPRDNSTLYIVSGAKQADTFLGANIYENHGIWNGQEFKVQDLVSRNVINTIDTYTFSTYIKYTGDNPSSMMYFFNGDETISPVDGQTIISSFKNTTPNTWNQISFTFKFNSLTPPSSGKFYVGFEFYKSGYNGNVYWACPKLEKGTKATDYSIAPEDIDSSLNANKNEINQTNNAVNTANNNITSLQGNVDSINNQLAQQQNQLKGLSTINYVPNSDFITNPQNGLAETGAHPLLWRDYSNERSTIADWGGQPLSINNYTNNGQQTIDLTKDYADCIQRGWVGKDGATNLDSNNISGLINRLITVVPGDIIKITNDNVDDEPLNSNYIAWYDKDKNFVTTSYIPAQSSGALNISFTVPYKCYYAKIGVAIGSLGTHNTYKVIYNCKNMFAENNIIYNSLCDVSQWTNVNLGKGTFSNTTDNGDKAIKVVNTWTQYQETGIKITLPKLTPGKVHTLTLLGSITSASGSIRLVTNGQTYNQILTSSGGFQPMSFDFIPGSDKTITLYFDAPAVTYIIKHLKISNIGSNNDIMNIPLNKDNWGSYVHGSTISLSDNTMFGSPILTLASNGGPSNGFGYKQGFIEGKGYLMRFWAKSDSGTNTLHMDQWGGFNQKNISIGNTWTYVEMPIIYSQGSNDTSSYLPTGSERSCYLWNSGTTSNIQIAGFGVYDYSSDAHILGYFDDNTNAFEVDASSATHDSFNSQDTYVRIWRNNKPAFYPTTGRGTTVTLIDNRGNLVSQKTFDTWGDNNCTALVNYLNGLGSNNNVVVLTTSDANTLDSQLQTWLENHGVPKNLITTYNQQRVRMCFIGTLNNSYNCVQPKFALEGGNTKYQPNTWGGSLSARYVHYNVSDNKFYCLHSYPVAPNSWITYTEDTKGKMDFSINVFYKEGIANDANIVYNSKDGSGVNTQTVSIYSTPESSFLYNGYRNSQFGIYNMPYDLAPKLTTSTIPVVTSTHSSRITARSDISYDINVNMQLEIADNKRFDNSILVPMLKSNNTHYVMNYLIDGSGEDGWNKYVRLVYTLPVSTSPIGNFRGNNGNNYTYFQANSTNFRSVLTMPALFVTQSDIKSLPNYISNKTALSQNSVQINQNYNGVKINDTDGITITSGNNQITLNANVGIDIWGNSQHNMSLDTNGNLIMRGNLVAGNISGVNIGGVTFTGKDMNLDNVLNVNGKIKSNGVVVDQQGLHVTDGDITLGAGDTLIGAPGNVVQGWIPADGSWSGSPKDNGYRQVPITGGSTLTFAVGQIPDYRRNQIAFYDSSKTFISMVTNQDFSGTHSITMTAPSNAAYVSFSVYAGSGKTSANYPMYIYQNGNTNTLLMSDGTMIANNAILSGTLTSNNVNITGGSINLVKPDGNVAFHVDSTGNAVFSGNLSGVNIMGNNSTLSGMLAVNGTLSAANNNVILNNSGITINKGSINISNGNGTTFSVHNDGTLLANNATITGSITANKLVIASNADVSINVNGQFTVDRNGNVFAGSLTLKNGTINSSNMYGSSIIGSTLKLADTYWNEFYSTNLSRTQYDEYGLRSGYTLNGTNINRHGVITHSNGVRERKMQYLVMALNGEGFIDSSGNSHSTTTNIYTPKIQPLYALNDTLHIRLTNGPSNVFTNGGTRRIVFYNGNNAISSYETSSNNIDVNPPSNATGYKLCIYVGNNGYSNWLNATSYSNLTDSGNYMDNEDSVIAWQGSSGNPGYDMCLFNYGTTDPSQLNVTRDNMWITALQLDSSQLADGDIIKLALEINYDNSFYKPGGQFWLSVNGKSMKDSNPYFGSTNLKYAVVGNYSYVWYFTYHSDLGNNVIINLNMQGMQSGSRFYITDCKEVLHSTRNPNYYGTDNNNEGAMNVITQDGKIRQTYDIYQTNGNIINSRMRDVQQYNGYFTLQSQSRLYNTNNNTINEGYNDFSAIYMSGDGLSFVGDFNKHYVEDFMYSGALTASADNRWQGGAAITLWGNISHETLLEHDFNYELGSGLVIDIWGNLHLMYSSVSWNVNDARGVCMFSLDQRYNDIVMGNLFGANVPGVPSENYYNGNDHIFKFTGGDGHITIGRMWMSAFGTENQANSDVDFHLRNDNGWFRFFSGVASSDGTFHTISSKEDKYDIALLDTNKSINAIQNTDFARFHYRNQHDRAESYQKGVIIDNSNNYSIDNSFVDDNGKTLNIMNLVATLADVVKEQQKQISELNAKVAYLEINK